jgi:glutamate-5-semialdehyde dehydrogenase
MRSPTAHAPAAPAGPRPAAPSPARALALAAHGACRTLAAAPTERKDAALAAMARALRADAASILTANAQDVAAAEREGRPESFLDRLRLTPARVAAMADAVDAVRALPDPVGEVTERSRRPNGLKLEKVRIPLGLVLIVYEARPNVTSDAAALCLKSGNAVLLRGGKEALGTNAAVARCLRMGLVSEGLPGEAVTLVGDTDREVLKELLQLDGLVDLCIPRGGQGLIRFVAEHARVPVVRHAEGVCHVYVHADADLAMAERVLLNAKTSRPGVCNAAECLLVDREVAEAFLPRAGRALAAAGVELRACPTSAPLLARAGVPVRQAAPDDYGREFLALTLAVRVVPGLEGALEHVSRFGTGHTEAILTRDAGAAARFTREVVASAVVVNASTRFNDGGELGLGAEIGISTSRLHAYGPMGLRELTSQKYVVHGSGQVR